MKIEEEEGGEKNVRCVRREQRTHSAPVNNTITNPVINKEQQMINRYLQINYLHNFCIDVSAFPDLIL